MGRWGGRDCPYSSARDGGPGSGIKGHTTANELESPFQKGTPEDVGYNAYKSKKNSWDNPYDIKANRTESRNWMDGFNRAQADSKKPKNKSDTRHWALKQLDED